MRRLVLALALIAPLSCESTAPKVPTTVTVTMASSQLEQGDTARVTVTPLDAGGKTLTGLPVTYTSGNGAIAKVDSTGLVTGLSAGAVTIYASVKGVSGNTPITVILTVSTVTLTVPVSPLDIGDSTKAAPTATSVKGANVTGRPVTYGTSDSLVAKVSSAGYVRGISAGSATISATIDGHTGSTPIVIQTGPTSVEITPPAPRVELNSTLQLTATARDGGGAAIPGRTFTWTSNDTQRATVSSDGLVTWKAPGRVNIKAQTGAVSSTVQLTAGGDYSITGVHVTQGVQDIGGTVPMIPGDAPAAFLVYMTTQASVTASMRVVLRLLNAADAVVYTDTTTVTQPIGVATSLGVPTAQFLVPANQIVAGRKWQVLRDPTAASPDDSAATDVFPRGAPAVLNVHLAPPLLIRFVPIVLTAHGGTAPSIAQSDLTEYLRTVRSTLPVGAITATIAAGFSTNTSFGVPPSGGASTFWVPVLSELDAARVADVSDSPETHWMGVVGPPTGFTSITNGGWGYRPVNPQGTGPFTRTALVVRTGWANTPSLARDNTAHELGHNFGRLHSPCGGPAGPDPNYPQPDGRLGQLMHDVYIWSGNPLSTIGTIPSSNGDLMGYCFPLWSSVYTYTGIITARGVVVPASAPVAATDVITIQGSIPLDGSGPPTLLPTLALRGRPTRPEAGDHHLLGYDENGQLLFDHAFEPTPVDHAPVALFTFALPVDATTQRLARLRVTGPAGTTSMTEFLPAAQAVSGVQRNADGRVAATCSDVNARIAIQDEATGRLLGISRGSMTVATNAQRLAVSCGRAVRPVRRVFSVR